jgi:choline dehydrogenase-like flavoprotein
VLKELMRLSPLRRRVAGLSMVGEDMPQVSNRVDLDPHVRDVHGLPVPRITHSPHQFEIVASTFFAPLLDAICRLSPNAIGSLPLPVATLAALTGGDTSSFAGPASTAHIMGTARMGSDPRTSVVDAHGRLHDVDNVYIADGSVFVSSGGFNPTLTIMALALRMARNLN